MSKRIIVTYIIFPYIFIGAWTCS